jgi:hypothetical protein
MRNKITGKKRWRGLCPDTGKLCYPNRNAAEADRFVITHTKGRHGLAVYQCQHCAHWHLGRPWDWASPTG